VRRRIAYIAAIMASGAFAALPGAVASGDSSGGTAAPSDPPAQAPPQDPSAQAPVASPGKPALSPPGAAVVGQWITLNGLVASEDAGSAVAVQQQTPTGDWADVGTATSGRDGSFSVRWRPMTVGRIALRALIADTSGARAADAASEVEVTVFKRTRASWYGPGMYGKRTACGQRLTPQMLGVAHKTLPCGTKVQLFYGGRSVLVPVIDRGPYANGATFDLTKATADQLGVDGVFNLGYAIIPV
jgi:peptidoglycan lytic transglycosylase